MKPAQQEKKVVSAKDLLDDIRAGLSDQQLMRKYKLSLKGLRSAFDKMLNLKVLSEKDFYARPLDNSVADQSTVVQDTVIVEDERDLIKLRPKELVPIYGNHPSIKGYIKTISPSDISIVGLQTTTGEKRTFIIMPQKYLPIEPITFEAKCQWVKKDSSGNVVAGFKIFDISPESEAQLGNLIRLLYLEDY